MRGFAIFVGALVLLGLAGALLVPWPRTVPSEYVLVPFQRVEVAAPREGVFTEVADAGVVKKGDVLARYDLAPLEAKKKSLQQQAAALQKQLEAPPNPDAASNLVKANAALKSAEAALKKAKGRKRVAAQKKVKAAQAAVAKATAALPKDAAELEKPLAELNQVLESVDAQLAAPTVTAPVSGVFAPSAKVGETVPAHVAVGVVEDTARLKARVKVPSGEALKRGQVVELALPNGVRRVTFDADAKDGVADAEFDNRTKPLAAGVKGTAEVEVEPKPLLRR